MSEDVAGGGQAQDGAALNCHPLLIRGPASNSSLLP